MHLSMFSKSGPISALPVLCCQVKRASSHCAKNPPLFVFSKMQPLAYRLWCATPFRETMIFIISAQDFHSCSFCLFKDYIQGERHPFCLREFTNLLCLEITCHLINDLPCGLSLATSHRQDVISCFRIHCSGAYTSALFKGIHYVFFLLILLYSFILIKWHLYKYPGLIVVCAQGPEW